MHYCVGNNDACSYKSMFTTQCNPSEKKKKKYQVPERLEHISEDLRHSTFLTVLRSLLP